MAWEQVAMKNSNMVLGKMNGKSGKREIRREKGNLGKQSFPSLPLQEQQAAMKNSNMVLGKMNGKSGNPTGKGKSGKSEFSQSD